MKQIILKKGKERSILNKHPWIFSGAVQRKTEGLNEGDVVEVVSIEGKHIAIGHYHDSGIMVRIFSFENRTIDFAFWKSKIENAITVRAAINLFENASTNCYRLVNGEGDGLPGLIIDIYNKTAVIQTHSEGMYNHIEDFSNALIELYNNKLDTIYFRPVETKDQDTGSLHPPKYLHGELAGHEIIENGNKFFVDWEGGQKTGFFLDQRENRNLLGNFCKDKNVLNAFSYTGGFSIYALKGGARLVHSVDSSKSAAIAAQKNIELNFEEPPPHEFFVESVNVFLKNSNIIYDVIVLDPPAFAKRLSAAEQAIIGYRNINTEALKRISPNGILFTFSCSQAIDKETFRRTVFQAALQAKRNVRILHQLTQPADHPISVYHPEGEYLKGLVLFVE